MVYQNPLYWKISITHLLCFHKALCFFCQFNMLEWFIRIPYCVFKFPYSWEHYQFAENVPNPGGWLFSIGDFDKPFANLYLPDAGCPGISIVYLELKLLFTAHYHWNSICDQYIDKSGSKFPQYESALKKVV